MGEDLNKGQGNGGSVLNIGKTPITGINGENKKIKNTRFSIAGKISDIIENSIEGEISQNEAQDIEKYMKKYIKLNFKNFEQLDLIPIFKKYFNHDKSLNTDIFDLKFNKYLPIHFPILIEHIKGELLALTYLPKQEQEQLHSKKENLILNLLKKYSYILFIFGEKINLSELAKILKLDIKAISSLRQSVSQNMNTLESLEQKQIDKLYKESKIINSPHVLGEDEKKDPLFTEHFCATTYRNTFKKVMSEGKDITIITSLDSVGEEIEQLYKLKFKKLFSIFKKWYESDGTFGDSMDYLEDMLKKILGSITIFKDSNIAFTESFSSNIRQTNFLNDVNNELIEGNINLLEKGKNMEAEKELIELFKEFIKLSVSGLERGDFLEFIKKIKKLKKETAESKIPNSLTYIDNINLNKIDFDDWDNTHESQKYELMFSKIISKNGILTLSKYLKLDEIDSELVLLFTDSFGINYEVVMAQFQEIRGLAKSGITIKDFVKNDINNLNLLIIWWRFLLKIRKIEKEFNINGEGNKKTITVDHIKKIKEKHYGVIEIISEQLKEKRLLESNKLEFKPDGKLNNISIETIHEQLKSVLNGLKKGPIDLNQSSINIGNEEVLVKDITELYIPLGVLKKDKFTDIDKEMTQINDWINTGIDLCFNLVKNKPITDKEQKKYLRLLKRKNILPKNVNDITLKDKDNIKNLVETLKYIKHSRNKLKEMMLIGNSDKNNLIELLGPLLSETKEKMVKDCFGPDKSFHRAFTKLIKLYAGDFTLIGDLTRLRVIEENINDMISSVVKFISFAVESDEITHVSIVDNIGEPVSDPKKKSGYRDIKLFLNLKGGNVVETQFQYKEMLDVKEVGIDLSDGKNGGIFEKLKKEGKLFTIEEMREFIEFATIKNIPLPTIDILNNLLKEGNVYGLISELEIPDELLSQNFISTNYSYNLVRQLPEDSILKKKITKLERILSDNTWAGAVLKYLENKGVKIE